MHNMSGNQAAQGNHGRARIIVFGNEKGGSGKSTTAMHTIVGLLRQGAKVGAIDLDARQGTLSRYCLSREKRQAAHIAEGLPALPCPRHLSLALSDLPDRDAAQADERSRLEAAIMELSRDCDAIVIDTPGTNSYLSRLAHSWADTLVTPMNDSFVDLDLLAEIEPDTLKIIKPSVYAEMVWQQRQQRAARGMKPVDWIVMRNRLGHIDARNKREIAELVDQLAARLGFRVAAGFGERVIFRELFLKGLTMLDLREEGGAASLSLSHVAARQEVRSLIDTILSPPVNQTAQFQNRRTAGQILASSGTSSAA